MDTAEGMAARRSGGVRGGSFGFWLLVAVAAMCLSAQMPVALGACIDSVCSPKLQFPSSPRAGEQVEMTISFTLDLQFQINDYVEVFLPGFTGALASPPGGGEFLLSWFSETSRLRIQQIQATPAAANVELTAYVSKSDQISLPPFGLETNQADVQMRAVLTAHVNGSTSFRPFEIVEPVGVMLNTTLAFSPDHVGEPVSVELGFTHSSGLEAPDTVSVFLSAFVKSTGTNPESGTASYVVCAGQYSADFPPDCGGTGSLSATATDVGGGEGVRVDITIADLIRAGESVTVTIPASFGITIPPGGTSLNNQQHVIGTSAALGPVNNPFSQTAPPGTSIESSQEVLSPRIRVEPAKLPTGECSSTDMASGDCTAWLDESVDLTLGFAHTAAFQEGHYVRFTLPGFTRQTFRSTSWNSDIANITDCSGSNCDIASGIATTGANSSEIGNATWIEGDAQLELIFTAPVAATRYLEVTIPSSAGLTLPRDGLALNSPSLRYLIFSGSVYAETNVRSSPAVGAFVTSAPPRASTQLLMPTAKAGSAAHLAISFVLDGGIVALQCVKHCGTRSSSPSAASVNREILSHTTVTLTLDGFSRESGSLDHFVTLSDQGFTSASWISSSNQLVLSASADVPAMTSVVVSVPSTAGIRPPSQGLTLNQPSLKIETDAQSGPVPATAIARSSSIGKLHSLNTTLSPPLAGVVVQVSITFAHNRDLEEDDSVTIEMPGFSRSASLPSAFASYSTTVNGVPLNALAAWQLNEGGVGSVTVTLLQNAGVTADDVVHLEIGSDELITSPFAGLPIVRSRKMWRVTAGDIVNRSWSLSSVSLFSDAECTEKVSTQGATYVASSGQDAASYNPAANDCDFNFSHIPAGNGSLASACPEGMRLATRAEIEMCKSRLCDEDASPPYLAAQGDGGFILGSAYSCRVGSGLLSVDSSAICINMTSPASWAFDDSSSTIWTSVDNATGISGPSPPLLTFVGVVLDQPASVRCAIVDQPDEAAWRSSTVIVQASDDGDAWVDILLGNASKGISKIETVASPSAYAMDSPFVFSASALRGSVERSKLASLQPLGSFGGSASLEFGVPLADNATSIKLTVTPIMDIDAGEILSWNLPEFGGDPVQDLSMVVVRKAPAMLENGTFYWRDQAFFSPAGQDQGWANDSLPEGSIQGLQGSFVGQWDGSTITISMGDALFGGMPVVIEISASNGITVAPDGIRPDDCTGCSGVSELTLNLSTNASSGPVVATTIPSVQRIGVLTDTRVNYGELVAFRPINVSIAFTLNRPLVTGDAVFLHLTGFGGNSSVFAPVQSYTAGFGDCSWDTEDGLVTVVVTSDFAAFTRISLVVPAEAGVRLPLQGMAANTSIVRISSNATAGPVVLPQTVDSSPAMGAFVGDPTRLSYTPAEFTRDGQPYFEGRIASITLGFSLNVLIQRGEVVFARLFDFTRLGGDTQANDIVDKNGTNTGDNITLVDTNGVFNNFMNASWDESESLLSLTASSDVPAYQRHVVLIPSTAGLRLPKIGLVPNDPRLTIGTDAVAGPNTGTPIERSPALNKVCGAECAVWSLSCDECTCGQCAAP